MDLGVLSNVVDSTFYCTFHCALRTFADHTTAFCTVTSAVSPIIGVGWHLIHDCITVV